MSTEITPKKIGFVSLGCPKNLVDSEVMMGLLAQQGYELTPDREAADILVVNTCGFIDAAKQESVETILEMAQLKAEGRCQKLVVTGCLVERYRQDLGQEIPEIDAMLGTNELEDIIKAVETRPSSLNASTLNAATLNGPALSVPLTVLPNSLPAAPAHLYLYNDHTPRVLTTPRYSAYIKIAEGCDHPCSFCVIPQFRGNFRSRPIDSILREAERLAAQGVKELNLIGQDTTDYGKDLGLKHGLAHLLRELNKIEGLEWIRFLYAYPNNVNEELLDAMAESDRVAKYIDIPLQHASGPVLKSMRRGGNRRYLTNVINLIRARVPGVTVRSTFIVGFPGETEDDFAELLSFIKEMEFDNVGAFVYSDEEEGAAYNLGDKVPHKVAVARQNKLMREQAKIAKRKTRAMIGQQVRVLIEGPSRESELLLQGRTMGQAPEIDGVVLINDMPEDFAPEAGQFVTVEVTDAAGYDLIGRIV